MSFRGVQNGLIECEIRFLIQYLVAKPFPFYGRRRFMRNYDKRFFLNRLYSLHPKMHKRSLIINLLYINYGLFDNLHVKKTTGNV